MLLRVGVIMIVATLALAAGVTAVVGLLHGEPVPATTPTEPLAVETKTQDENKPNLGEKLEINDEPIEKPRVEDKPAEKVPEKPPAERRQATTSPIPVENGPQPSQKEVVAANTPRYYQPQHDSTLSLTVPAIGLHEVPVINSKTREALAQGVIHLPETPMPWEQREQKNVYIAGHRLGYEGTGSRLVFYNLNKLKKGDSVTLKDGSGASYNYQVSDVFVATPDADWVVDPLRGHDMLTLQTCTIPDFKNRLIVRADRI